MNHRRTLSAAALALAVTLPLAPATAADRGHDRTTPSLFADSVSFLAGWFAPWLGFEPAPTATQTTGAPGCGEAGPDMDPDGRRCPAATTTAGDAGPDSDPDGR